MGRKTIILIGILVGLASCSTGRMMSRNERRLINSGSEGVPMDVLRITVLSDSLRLRSKSKNIDPAGHKDDFQRLISRMKKTLEAERGVGIAAPQVGILRNVFLFVRTDKPGKPLQVVVNPRIVAHSEEMVCFERDGCLSIPNYSGNSLRYAWVEAEYQNEQGITVRETINGYSRRDNFAAVIFQHEFDHLQGVFFIDKLCK